eukprot:snap_masked-scaffold_12-processed-gene-1.45-mRNA-1 protein AED:1.00 eAED:1.00 QI:0/-1/0/0/-1/1/1/0/342
MNPLLFLLSFWVEQITARNCVCALTTFFNPLEFETRKSNLEIFLSSLLNQNVPVVLVWLEYFDENGQLVGGIQDILDELKARDLIQYNLFVIRRSTSLKNVMWHKENLLNLGLESDFLQEHCENVAWVDADVIFWNDNWSSAACTLLQKHQIIRPFNSFIATKEAQREETSSNATSDEQCSLQERAGNEELRKISHPGYAWAASAQFLLQSKFFDLALVGGADRIMSVTFSAESVRDLFQFKERLSRNIFELVLHWGASVMQVRDNSSVLNCPECGDIKVLTHGSMVHRQYQHRHNILVDGSLEVSDISKVNGVYEWNTFSARKMIMQRRIQLMFLRRREDN